LSKELDEAIALLLRMVESEGEELVRDRRVRSAVTELKKSRKGGQCDANRLVRAVHLIAEVASDRYVR
jgi:hypothetical protein